MKWNNIKWSFKTGEAEKVIEKKKSNATKIVKTWYILIKIYK